MKRIPVRPAGAEGEHLYESVAFRIGSLIEHGTLRAGDRVPSVRRMSQQEQVSITTAIQAYRLLENRGLLEARPQSGYYVRPQAWKPPAEPDISRPTARSTKVNVTELVMRVMYSPLVRVAQSRPEDRYVSLGNASPNPDLLPTAALNRCLSAAARRHAPVADQCPFPQGERELRVQIARRAMAAGCSLSPDELVIRGGCQEAIGLALRAVTQPGDTVAIESPAYYGSLQMIEHLGLKACEIPTFPREGVCLEELERRLDSCRIRACLFTLNYSNPLGSCMPDWKKAALVELLGRRGIPLIEDDVFGDITFDRERPKVAKAFDQQGLVLTCNSFGKTLAPGYRVGWIAPGRFFERVRELKFITSVATATLPQFAIADFLANGGYDHHMRRIRRAYASQLALYQQAVAASFPEGTKVTRPNGGWVLWVELLPQVDSLELVELALKEKITVAPGPIFSATRQYQNFIRLSCGAPWSDTIERAVTRVGQIAEKLSR